VNKDMLTLPVDCADWLAKQLAQECPEFRIGQRSAAQLPGSLDTTLPSIEELETELSRTLKEGEEP
jgi:hypothetical protein